LKYFRRDAFQGKELMIVPNAGSEPAEVGSGSIATGVAGPDHHLMSALAPKATRLLRGSEMTQGPQAEVGLSLDHFVGAGEQGGWYG
jgi:hypothetical protein